MDMKYYLISIYDDFIIRECGCLFVNFLLEFFIHISIMTLQQQAWLLSMLWLLIRHCSGVLLFLF